MFVYLIVVLFVFRCLDAKTGTNTNSNFHSQSNSEPLRGHSLFKVFPKNVSDLETLANLKEKYGWNFDFWSRPNKLFNPVLFSVSPSIRQNVVNSLVHSQINSTLVTNDLKIWVDKETEYLTKSFNAFAPGEDTANFETYNPYERIGQILDSWKSKYPNVRVYKIGETYEKREIKALTITHFEARKKNGTRQSRNGKNVVFFECGIHAREWVSPATCLYIANQLLTNKNEATLLNKYDFHFVPVTNADGYAFTWTTNRSWRRNRHPGTLAFAFCYGVDVNRNFDSHHCGQGASVNPCDDSYCGTGPFSEKESRAIRDYVSSVAQSSKIKLYLSVHSFSQLWMYPYGFTDAPSPKYDLYTRVSQKATNAIRRTHGEDYRFGQISRVLYKASGSSVDWIDEKGLAELAFVVELRDKGNYGFMLPAQFIRPTAEETWNGVKSIIN